MTKLIVLLRYPGRFLLPAAILQVSGRIPSAKSNPLTIKGSIFRVVPY